MTLLCSETIIKLLFLFKYCLLRNYIILLLNDLLLTGGQYIYYGWLYMCVYIKYIILWVALYPFFYY